MVWHQVPIYCSDCNYCVTRDAAASQGNGTPPRRVDVLIERVKFMSLPACKCGPAARSCRSSCMLKHFHIINKIRELCSIDRAVLWHCAMSRFQSLPLLSYRKSAIGVSGWLFNPYPTAFPYGNGMVLHFYQQQESSTTKTVHKVINKGLKAYV